MRLRERHKKYLTALGVTLLAFLLSQILLSPLTFSASSIMSTADRKDFTVTDFYCHVADKRAVRTLDPDVVIIDIGDLDRNGIASVLETVGLCDPRAVGVDVLFEKPREDDSRLIAALRACPNLIMAQSVRPVDGSASLFRPDMRSFLMDSLPAGTAAGATNFPTVEGDRTIREFRVEYPGRTDTVPSFALAIARVASPFSAEMLLRRGNTEETINFCSRTYDVFTPDDLDANIEKLIGKIILLGSLNHDEDVHITPVDGSMTGVQIHAHTLSTILSESYFYKLSKLWNWAIAFISCFLVIAFSMFIPAQVKGVVMRLFQIFILYLTIRYGYDLFIDHNLIVNFSYSLLMITFGLLANDFWNGTAAFIRWLREKWQMSNLYKFYTSR